LADLIYKFGEDRASRRIARFIVQHRPKRAYNHNGTVISDSLQGIRPAKAKGESENTPGNEDFSGTENCGQ
ncbi:unnamed protein product, partial [marine sediment metagenome]